MKKKKAWLIGVWSVCLSLAVCVACWATAAGHEEVAAAKTAVIRTEIADKYDYAQSVRFPESVAIEYGGESYTGVNPALTYPRGATRSAADEVVLREKGEYTLSYYFTADGIRRSAETRFTVYDSYYTLTTDNGSSIARPTEDEPLYTFNNTSDGLIVRLAEGCDFVYNKPIDLATGGLAEIITIDPRFGEREDIEINGVTAKRLPSIDARQCSVRLTDCYDERVYVEIKMFYEYEATQMQGHGYFRAGSNSQRDVGLVFSDTAPTRPNDRIEKFIDGRRAVAYYGNLGAWGIAVAQRVDTQTPNGGIKLLFDNDTGKVYFTAETPTPSVYNTPSLINDLRSQEVYSSNNLFDGFTTGEVYVSVRVEEYINPSTRVDILSIGGEIYAAVGDTVTLPQASARDVNLTGGVNLNVYQKYKTDKQTNVNCTDHAFTVTAMEKYYAVYTARDTCGNVGETVLSVIPVAADETTEDGKLTVRRAIDFSVDKLAGLVAGERATLPTFTAQSLNGGAPDVRCSVRIGDREVAVKNNGFVPVKAGTYTLTYTISDRAVTYERSYDVTCAPNPRPAFIDTPHLPKYYVRNATYDVPQLVGYTLGETAIPTVATVTVQMDDGAFSPVSDTFTVTATDSVRFAYSLQGGAEYVTEAVPVRDVSYGKGTLMMHKYFVGDFTVQEKVSYEEDGAIMEGDNPDVLFESTLAAGDNRLEFINELLFANFVFEFRTPADKSNFTRVKLVFTDVFDENKQMTLTFENIGGALYASADGGLSTRIPDTAFTNGRTRRITFDPTLNNFTVNSNTRLRCAPPFSSPYVYFAVELEDIRGAAAVQILRLNNQAVSGNIHIDNATPEAYFPKENGYKKPNETVTVYAPKVGDVLSPVLSRDVKVTVEREGQPVRSVDGVLLDGTQDMTRDYSLFLGDERTVYTVTLTVKDTMYASAYVDTYEIAVVDVTPPVITLDDGYTPNTVLTLRRGATFSFGYSVHDDYTADDRIVTKVQMRNETTYSMLLNVGNSIVLNETGRFTVYVFAYDEAGNYSFTSFRLEVVE